MILFKRQMALMASLLDEAAEMLRQVPEDVAEKLQIRFWLPDELEGCAIMLRDYTPEFCGLQPIETAPKDGTYVLVACPSGYTTTPLRFHAARYHTGLLTDSWVTDSNDCVSEFGEEPIYWAPLPTPPGDQK